MACQHFPDDQTPRLRAGAGEDDLIHLPSGPANAKKRKEKKDGTAGSSVTLLSLRI